MLKRETFLKRLKEGKVNNLEYCNNELMGLVSVWKHKDQFIVTWEECKDGDHWNESSFTKDERHIFHTIEQLIEFLEGSSLVIENFKP